MMSLLTLPNVNSQELSLHHHIKINSTNIKQLRLLPIMTVIKANGYITRSIVSKIYGIKPTQARHFLSKLTHKNILIMTGKGRGTKYKPKNKF